MTPSKGSATPQADRGECASCGEGDAATSCPKSKRRCGHHCNHSWTHDACCWCGKAWDDETNNEENANG